MSNSHRRNSLATPQARAGRRGGLTTWAGHSREEMLEVSARGGRKTFGTGSQASLYGYDLARKRWGQRNGHDNSTLGRTTAPS